MSNALPYAGKCPYGAVRLETHGPLCKAIYAHCERSLFWRHKGRDAIRLMAGALDRPKTRTASHHMRAEQAGDCSLSDGMPQRCSERQVHGESGSLL